MLPQMSSEESVSLHCRAGSQAAGEGLQEHLRAGPRAAGRACAGVLQQPRGWGRLWKDLTAGRRCFAVTEGPADVPLIESSCPGGEGL